jgi:heptosyltransferase-3
VSAPDGGRVLAVRLDSAGDVLLAGPAVRALAATAEAVDLLVSPAGEQAARLLPGVARVLVFDPPWSGYRPPPVSEPAVRDLVELLRRGEYRRAVIFTSYHQSPLPMALLAKLAGIPYVAADSADYPGSLLDLRHRRGEAHEVTAALALARAAGGRLPAGDTGRPAVTRPLPDPGALVPADPYVVVHPGAAVPARAPTPTHAATIIAALRAAGWPVVLTGGPSERALADQVMADQAMADQVPGDEVVAGQSLAGRAVRSGRGGGVTCLVGRTSLDGLAGVLERAACVVVGNTGPAHLAAAVGTPVVSLFAPVVPAGRWGPFGVPSVVLGDQDAPCRDSRARDCPVPGHPCLTGVGADQVVAAVRRLAGEPGGARAPAEHEETGHELSGREEAGREEAGRELTGREMTGRVGGGPW